MGKLEEKYIDLGTGSKQVADKSLPSIFSPSNYSPAQVATEGVDKVSSHLKGIDAAIGSLASGSSISIQDEGNALGTYDTLNFVGTVVTATNLGSGVTQIEIVAGLASFRDQLFISDGVIATYSSIKTLSATGKIDVYFDGLLGEEGGDWQRDTVNNEIDTLPDVGATPAPMPDQTRIRARVYSFGWGHADEHYIANGSNVQWENTEITEDSLTDVYVNGALGEEGKDWSRNGTFARILDENLNPYALLAQAKVLVRVHSTADFQDEIFNGGTATLMLTTIISSADKIDVYFNGRLTEESNDWSRSGNVITIVDDITTSDTRIRVRIWN